MKNISLFKNFITEIGSRSLAQIIGEIRGDDHKYLVSKIRRLVGRSDRKEINQLKKELVTFTVSGLFRGSPSMVALKIYNPFVILDINELNPEVLPYLFLKIKGLEFTRAVFKNPDGLGLKVIVEVDAEIETHSLAFYQVRNFYKKELGIEIGKSGRSVAKLCFMSHDPEACFNKKSKVFKITESGKGPSLNQKILAATTVASPESAKKSGQAPVVFPPAIPLQVYNKLPALLKKGCKPFKDRHQERDTFLTGALGVLSGLLSGISGVYDGQVYYPNLFVFVTAPPASGKGVFNFAKCLGTAYQNQLLKLNKKRQEVYQRALVKFELDKINYKKGVLKRAPKAPEQPNFKNLFPPANMDTINLIEHLSQNEDSGILFESEADSLGNVLAKDWGGYSDLLRRSFRHESTFYSRKSDGGFIGVTHPKLSIALSGTPDQLTTLIPSAEDGLLSRFMFYAFEGEAAWRDVSPKGKSQNHRIFYEDLSEEVLEVITFLKFYPSEFTFSEEQWEILNSTFQKMMEETKQDFGMEALCMVRRMELNCFRIAMVLSAIRKFQEKRLQTKLVCNKDDFKVAVWLAETYLKHGLFVYERLPVFTATSFYSRKMKNK